MSQARLLNVLCAPVISEKSSAAHEKNTLVFKVLKNATKDEIKAAVDRFTEYAKANNDKTFLVSKVGCSKAGYTPSDIAPMFEQVKAMTNVYLPREFREVLDPSEKEEEVEAVEDVTADMELTELQKESMKEMLSIKSGELLDNVLNK